MDDQSILHRIQHLVDEEHRLDARNDHSADDRHRHQTLQVELDQCWDLLRQRRARREFGKDPEKAAVRAPKIVEGYEQ